jgi:hypothetical protein
MWEFREAVASAGHYRSGPEAMRFYDTLADQINSACEHGTIQCLPRRSTLLPPFRREYLGETVQAGEVEAKVMFTMGDGQVGSVASVGPAEGIATFADTVGGVDLPDERQRVVQGWAAAASATPTVRLLAHTPVPVQSSTNITPAPDVLAVYPDLKAIRFELTTDCPVADCDLVLDIAGGDQPPIPLARLVHGAVIDTPQLRVYVDSAEVGGGYEAHGLSSRRPTEDRSSHCLRIRKSISDPGYLRGRWFAVCRLLPALVSNTHWSSSIRSG